jgi:hypothetical protein
MEAHRFAGLHKFGTPTKAPANYVREFSAPITLFEGLNGSGKTSLVNAIIWALTGEVLRAQREPEKASEEFECWIASADGSTEQTTHRLTPVTPLPDLDRFRPDQGWIPADTWVELTFEDRTGVTLPPIRRSQVRTAQGKLIETPPEFAALGVDPIALRIGTLMPGILPLIRVGSESELGKAVAQLTGLSSLADLADHVRRAKHKIDTEFVKAKTQDIRNADVSYERARTDLAKEVEAHPKIAPPKTAPAPSVDESIEEVLGKITTHFQTAAAAALSSAKSILGDGFDPSVAALRADLEGNITPALSEVKQLSRLASMSRLAVLRKLSADERSNAEAKLAEVLREAKTLQTLAENPANAARARLYAHVAMWLMDHPDDRRSDSQCMICGGNLEEVVDPVTGESVKQHIHDAQANATLISQTLTRWSEAALNDLTRHLPAVLQSELSTDLPEHPCDLIRAAFVDELFATAPFAGVLAGLKTRTANAFDQAVTGRSDLAQATEVSLPKACAPLALALKRLDRAIRFANWRQANDEFARQIYEQIVGRVPKPGETAAEDSLAAKLLDLEGMVKGAEPITKALTACTCLITDLAKRRAAEKRLGVYETATAALTKLLRLADLSDSQVEQLRLQLRTEATKWRKRIYRGAFPGTTHELIDATMSRRGELELVIGAGGVSAPVQHVANVSALRASLVGFFLAFWDYVLQDRGGLRLLLLDDPQEIFDEGNRELLAGAFVDLLKAEAQIIVTTNDPRFAGHVNRLPNCGIEHRSVLPATSLQPVVRTPLSEAEVLKLKKLFEADKDAEEPARAYANECRVFLEAMLGDLFDDPAYSGGVRATPAPTFTDYVNRLRSLTSGSPQGMFSAHVFGDFVNHPGVVPTAPTAKLLNKAHHGDRRSITPAEVNECADELADLVKLADKLHEECRRWCRRERDKAPVASVDFPAALTPVAVPNLKVDICPDLAAFTQFAPVGESQELSEPLDPILFASKALYYLRRDNFGFAAPKGAIAIVEADPLPVADRCLVIARHGQDIYARRFLRSEGSTLIGLTAETPDPRRSPKTKFLPEMEVALHQVVGVLFYHQISVAPGKEEAVQIDDPRLLERIEIAYRVVEESAVPLALPKQIALGGPQIELDRFSQHEGTLVALSLEDGSGVFKRVGATLPGNLSHLRKFESIGGLGSSENLSVGKTQPGVLSVLHARLIIGVLYHG